MRSNPCFKYVILYSAKRRIIRNRSYGSHASSRIGFMKMWTKSGLGNILWVKFSLNQNRSWSLTQDINAHSILLYRVVWLRWLIRQTMNNFVSQILSRTELQGVWHDKMKIKFHWLNFFFHFWVMALQSGNFHFTKIFILKFRFSQRVVLTAQLALYNTTVPLLHKVIGPPLAIHI